MRDFIFTIPLLLLLLPESAQGQENTFKLKGQADAYSGLKFTNPVQWQTGVRFIPSVSIEKQWKNNLKFDSEISFNSFLDYTFTGWEKNGSGSGIKPYRLWLRLSSERFELRAGLQKINFGSATMLRPLMWFDRMDPRDPLQLTDGVYGLLGRYYFQNNANVWLWILWGNDKTKGWETVPSARKIPEFGGRTQFPVPKGELALSYHHRTADLGAIINPVNIHGAATFPEDRLGIDGKWDIGVGLWGEYTLIHSSLDSAYFQQWSKLFTLGIDYTFNLGNGLYLATEFFRISNANKIAEPGVSRSFSLLTVNYPIGTNKIGGIIYYNLTDNSWYRFINLQRQSDNWTYYLFLFWNPDKIALYNTGDNNILFSGKGIQLMAVFNF